MTFSNDVAWLRKEKYAGVENEAFKKDIERLENGEPLAYIIGNIPFLNTTIYLDSRPLIPRPETEYWVEQAITAIKEKIRINNRPIKILDLCAGSGCLGVAVAKTVPETTVGFVELEEKHLATIKKNCDLNNINQDRVNIRSGDLCHLEQAIYDNKYDFILCNPPYIDQTLDRTEESVINFEPALALYGGEKGLELITSLLEQAPRHLTEKGELWLEHEPEQVEAIAALTTENGLTLLPHHDQFGIIRFSRLMLQ